MGIRARFEKGILRPLEKLDLREGEEVEIEIKRREKDILKYAGILKDLSDQEMELFLDATKRRKLFDRERS